MAYSKYYSEGWKNNESGGTPITAGALNHMENGIKTAVDNMDNTGSNVVTYTSEDQADSAVTRSTGWTTVSALVSGMTHSNLFNAMSKMFKNIRWLYKMLGTTDISSISSAGTVTGALAKLNTDLTQKRGTFTRATGQGSGDVDLSVWQSGHVMCIYGFLGGISVPANVQTLIGTISGVTLPITPVRLRGAAYSNAYSIGNDAFIFINTSGDIYVTATAASTHVYFDAVWIR